MGAENPFELSADAFEGRAGTLVAGVGVKADAEHLPGFEGVRHSMSSLASVLAAVRIAERVSQV